MVGPSWLCWHHTRHPKTAAPQLTHTRMEKVTYARCHMSAQDLALTAFIRPHNTPMPSLSSHTWSPMTHQDCN